MKKVLRIIVPILLIAAILAGTYWYLFIYDRAFTRDMLLNTARYFERLGNQDVATWFYDRAYEQGNGSDEVAIELARQYINTGNYTKAERTLFRAIEDGGGPEIYMTLCNIFVQQDKLIDAVDLLDNIQDAETKKQLDALRPAAPAPQHEPGLYHQYISIAFTAENGTVYANSSGDFPTIAKDLYIDPIALVDGENVICALTVSTSGLVSPMQNYEYTIGGIVEPMQFTDAAMEAAVRQTLNVTDEHTLYTNDLWNIKDFSVPADAQSYDAIKHMIFLESLTIHDGARDQLHVLEKLTSLKKLEIVNTPVSISELEIIGALSTLESLTLDNCLLATTVGLHNSNLTYLNLNNNAIRNIQALTEMTMLEEVHLMRNALTDLSALASCYELTTLDVSYNSISSITPICLLPNLVVLNISGNSISNLSHITNLSSLRILKANENALTDLNGISDCLALQELYLSNNQLSDISSLSALTQLTYFDFSHNNVTSLPKWPTSCALVTINGSHNSIKDLSNLSGLSALNTVNMDYNSNISSVDSLANCPNLIQVNVFGTKVTDVSRLTEQSIVVNYNPLND